MVEDRQLGRMIHKLINAHNNRGAFDYRTRKYGRKPYFTVKEVYEAFGVTRQRGEFLRAVYHLTNPWVEDPETSFILRYAKSRKLKPKQVLGIRNQTVRKDAMEAYGLERLIKDGGGSEVQSDDFGTLWKLDFQDGRDRFAMFVEVVNTTPEPDGHYAHYFLRVPPRTKTAREAVAWIGNLNTNQTMEFAGFAAQS